MLFIFGNQVHSHLNDITTSRVAIVTDRAYSSGNVS